MAYEDAKQVLVRTTAGFEFCMAVRAIEPMSDVAVLGPVDDYASTDYPKFLAWRDSVEPVPLAGRFLGSGGSIALHVFTREAFG